jgi:predicted ATP-grasp superfamily ATP-dependent carboligase
VSVSFLADGQKAAVVGFAEQMTTPALGAPYRFGGLAQPAKLGPRARQDFSQWVAALAPALGLVGLNSLDAMADGDDLAVLEINPRPGANLDVFDGAVAGHLFAHHVAACGGQLPALSTRNAAARALAVLYADLPLVAPDIDAWPDWIADRPMAGTVIPHGAPVCTVMADAPTADAASALANTRVRLAAKLLAGAPVAAAAE